MHMYPAQLTVYPLQLPGLSVMFEHFICSYNYTELLMAYPAFPSCLHVLCHAKRHRYI